ncbi:hypothetical protein JCM30566_11290 [Marinitoga arctica]
MKNNILGGLIFILLGGYLIISNIFEINIDWNLLWPVILLYFGLKFEISFFKDKKNPGILVPGGILISVSILFFLVAILGYEMMKYLWPGFILAPAIGLLQLAIASKKVKEYIFPIIFLSGLSILFFIEQFIGIDIWNYFIGLVFISVGINILTKRRKSNG